MTNQVSILLCDDHTLMRQGMRKILEERPGWTVVDEAKDGREAVAKAVELQPSVAIVDISMAILNGIEATRQIVRRAPKVQVLIVSMHDDDACLVQALQAGARGYLLKDSADVELVRGVTAVACGQSFFSPAIASLMLDGYLRKLTESGLTSRFELLSEREREVLQLVVEGQSSKDIADVLGVSSTTVDTHRAHIMRKLDLHSLAELVVFAVRHGVIG